EKLGLRDGACHKTWIVLSPKERERPSRLYGLHSSLPAALRIPSTPFAPTPLLSRCRGSDGPQILRRTTTIVACPYQTPSHRSGMLAALEYRNARRKRCFVAIDTLHEAPAASRHVVD